MAVGEDHPRGMTGDEHRIGREIFRAAGEPAFRIERVGGGGELVMLDSRKQLVFQKSPSVIHQRFIPIARENGDFQPRFHVINVVMQGITADIIDALACMGSSTGNVMDRLVKGYTRRRHDDGGIAVGKIHQRVGINRGQQGIKSGGVLLRIIAQQQFLEMMRVPVAVAGGAAGKGIAITNLNELNF